MKFDDLAIGCTFWWNGIQFKKLDDMSAEKCITGARTFFEWDISLNQPAAKDHLACVKCHSTKHPDSEVCRECGSKEFKAVTEIFAFLDKCWKAKHS